MRQDNIDRSDAPPPDRLAYRVREAAEVLAISRSRFYELVSAGEILVLKEGARTIVRRSELDAYLDRLEAAARAAAEVKAAARRRFR
ncbi:helix-turn-helix domain-containing protein [Caulobacter zeae]|nr:helix-turn-helix domain-containing protein [Caulobacter zeae]